ncbi:Angiotensin-converting enzyme [Phycisphaerae bacterium RAS1]|nr:Angiotensin-converting enzyme [Phycisphaerae bacterium RAS1]
MNIGNNGHSTSDDAPLRLTRRDAMKTALAAGAAVGGIGIAGCASGGGTIESDSRSVGDTPRDVNKWLRQYERGFQPLYTKASSAAWIAGTDVSDEHTAASVAAQQELDRFVGDKARMEQIASLRAQTWRNPPLVNRQLEKAWMAAAHAPGSIPELVKQRAEAEGNQSKTQDGFAFKLKTPTGEKPVNTNDIDEVLMKSGNLDERLAAWTASKEIGVALRPGLIKLQELRNRVGRELKFSSFFGLEVADYGVAVSDLMSLMKTVLEQTRPLYEQLHCYAKHKLAKKFGQPPPRRIPAHWLPNRWGQEWPGLEESVDLDPLFKDRSPQWIIEQAERFYTSMGMPKLPKTFWAKSDLYDLPADATRKKNRHASAWHIDLEQDVRSLMSVKSDASWFSTTHHELGHIYYYLAYTNAKAPLLLRTGANRAFHEGIGDLIALASKQQPYLMEIGILKSDFKADPARWLLAQALDGNFVFLPFACGTMTGFEHDLYERDLPAVKLNARWWELVQQHQGIDPPAPRGEEFCDAASKTHINDDPAGYYDYAIGTLIVYQLHDYIARKILKQDPRACNYYGRKDVGEYLSSLLKLGASRDWREVLRDFTGEDLSARAMMDYYAPLMEFLKKENAGKDAAFA